MTKTTRSAIPSEGVGTRALYPSKDVATPNSTSKSRRRWVITHDHKPIRARKDDMTLVSGTRRWVRSQADQYRHGEDRPLGGYVAFLGIYSTATIGAGLAAKALGRTAPPAVTPWELVQLALATHKLSRLIAKDPITSPLRAPFTTYEGTSAPAELSEQVRAHSLLGHSAGELITCPMCLAQWVATAFTLGLVVAPTTTRLTMATFSAVAGADFLQHLYVVLQQATEK